MLSVAIYYTGQSRLIDMYNKVTLSYYDKKIEIGIFDQEIRTFV